MFESNPVTLRLARRAVGVALMVGGFLLLFFFIAAVAISGGSGVDWATVVIACGYPVPWILLGYLLTFYKIDKTTAY